MGNRTRSARRNEPPAFSRGSRLPALALGAVRPRRVGAPRMRQRKSHGAAQRDGVGLTPAQYAALLDAAPRREKDDGPRFLLARGMRRRAETQCARLLGKERAIFMPTGTLANHMAVRALARRIERVLVQEQSHFYLD